MVRLNSVFRLAAKASTGSESIFAKAIVRAAAKPRPPSPPAFTPQQTVTPTTPQLNGGTTFQPINTSHTPMVGYGVYSPEYLQQLELNSEPPIYGPAVPENFDSPSVDPLIFDPLNGDDIFLPVDNAAEEEPVIDEEAIEQAEDLADEIAEGRGLDLFGDSELSREDVVEQLEAGGYEVESSEWGLPLDNITRTTITDPETGETIQEFYDHDTDRSWVKVVDEDGEELSTSDVRDDEGRKITVSEDEESGERTTRLEDDWGDGSVVEITELPNSDVVTITTTDSDGNSETVVVAEDGTRTTLDPEQDTSREGIDGIAEDVSEGKNLDQIAEERGLTREQVIAQLAAAGYEVEFETDELANGGEQYTTRIVDAEDGEEVIASYSSGRGTGNSSVYIDAEGNEIRRTEYGNGTVIETVIEADGRETTTTTVAENNGEAIEYEVQDGDYLIAIAERHGVTLEELEESNPEFFDSPRDPNVIHEGETVIIEGATQTTVEVTDNGYTLTTSPDGSKTLRNNEDGKEREIAQGSVDQTLAEELLELDPSDSDDDEALQEFIEEMLMGRDEEGSVTEFEDLETALSEQEEATQEAIEEIIGEEGDESDVIKPGESSGDSDPLGPPPDEETSNGEDWVPMRHEGNWAWVDPAVAEALEEEEAARTALEQALAEVRRRQAQIGVYAHSDEIMGNVGDRLDELLAPHGLRWVAPEPKGTAEEAQENLDSANAWIDYLEAKEEYREVAEEYQALQEEADDLKERALEIYGNDEDYEDFFKEEGFEEVIERGVRSQPDETEDTGELLEQSVVERDGQLYLRNVYADRDDPLYVRLTRDPASDPYGLSDAQQDLNQEWHDLKMGDEPAQLQSDALEAFREANPDYFDPDGYSETRNGAMGSEYEWESGELTDTRVVERDGQLYVINTYGEGFSKTTKEFPITYAPGEEPEGLTQAQRDASQAWQEFTRDKDVNEDLETRILEDARERHPDYFKDEGFTETTSSPAGREENPTGALLDQKVIERDGQLFLVNTYENLDEPLEIQLTFDPDSSGSTARTETQQQFDEDWESWKAHRYSGEGSLVQVAQEHAEAQRTLTEKSNEQNAGYIEELEGTIPDLERELEEAIEEHGEGSVGEDAEQIEIDGETRWVHPEVAAAHHDLVAARNALGEGEDILERAKELYGEQHPDHVKPGGFYESETEGNYTTFVPTGDLMGEGDDIFVGEDGQLYLRNRYEDRDDPYEFPLTYAPDEAPEGRTETQREIDRQWADWWEEHGHDGDSEDPLAEASQWVSEAEDERSGAIETYGGGTTRELTSPLPDDVEPVLVMIDGEQRWVHPDVAMALGALSMVEKQIASTRVAMEAAELALEEADYRSARPSTWKLLDDAASLEHEQGVMDEWQMEDAYLDAHGSGGALTRAWQDRVESREVLLTTQIGLAEAGLPMASVNGEGPDLDVTELREMLEENGVLGEQLAESSQWNDFLRGKSLEDRLDPDQWQARQERYFEQNPEVAEGATLDRLADLPSSVSMEKESAARQTLGDALGTHESAVVDPVLDQLRELGGSNADVDIVPILYRDSSEGVRDTALFRVRDEDGRAWLVDESGSKYRNFEDYRQHNYLSDKGHVFLPESPNRLTDASGDLTYEWHQAREKSFTEEWLDPIIGIGTGIATVLSFTPLAPIAAPIAFAGGAYFGARSVSNIHEMHEHGRPLASMEGALQGAMLATSVLPIASSSLRFAAMTSRGVDGTVAARTSIGAFNARRLQPDHPHYSPDYAHASQLLSQPGGAFAAARWSDVGAMGIGAPLLGYSSYNTAVHWDDMSGIERTDALLGVTSGIYGTGVGYRGLRASWPNQRGAREQAPPALPELNRTSTPWSTSGEFSTTTRLYPTAHMRAGSEAIDTAALQASLGGESPTPNAANHPPRAPDSLAGPFSGDMPEAAFPQISRQELAVASTDPQSVARLTSRQFSELSLFQLERFTLAQMRAIRASQLNALSNDQLAAFTPEQVAALDPQVLGKLAPEKFASLSTRQLSNLTEEQGEALRSWQLERLSSEQRALLPLTTRSSPQGEEVPASYQNSHDTGARKSSLIRFRDFVWNFVQQNSVRGGDRGAFRIPFWPKKENQGAVAIREEQGLPPWVNDADVQATAALKSLSPEEIAALSGEERQSIEPWHLLLLSPEQLKAWPDPPKPTRKLSFDEWHERSRLVLLKNTAKALLEPTVIRPRLAGLMGEVTPSHTEATAVFRGDTRGPDVIFLPGFQQRNPSDPHGGVSTSLSARKARWWASERASEGDTWVYTIISDISDGEIFQSLPARPKNKNTPRREADINDYEVRFSQGIVGQDILSARRVDSEGNYVGVPVYNPGFKDPARLPAYLSAEALQESQTVRGVDPKTERDLAAQLPAHDHSSPRILGHTPKDVSNIYIQPDIGPRPRGDEAGVRHKTHILYRDPETGEAFVMPWMRGASQNHVPSAQQTTTPPQGLTRLYRLDDLDALNQASTDGTLPSGHYVHIIRSSNTGLDNATFFIDGGTVPKSGRIDENGHLRWPSSQKGQPVRLSLHNEGNGQQTVRVEDTTGSEAPRKVTAKNGDVFVVISSERATETRAQIQGGGLPFALYSGNGLWSVSSNVSTSQSSTSTATPQATPATQQQQGTTPPPSTPATQQQQGTTPPPSTPATQQQQGTTPSPSTPASGRVTVSTDSQGPVVQIHGLGDGWTSVVGQSSRKIWPSPYDGKAKKQALPETTLVRRSVLEQALAPEDVAKLPNDPYVRVSLVAGSQGSGQVYTAPVHATGNDSSPARRRTARGLAVALVGGSLFGMHSASAHGWTGDVLNRAASPESLALPLNGSGFVTRGTLNFFKARFDEKIRVNREALEQGNVTAQLLNWEASRIIASRRALNLNKEQVARVGNVTEEIWARYQLLRELPVNQESVQRGWTEDAKAQALKDAASDYRTQLKEVAGEEALTVNPLDPRTVRGVIFNSSILATHLVNDVVSWQYLQNKVSDGEFLKISNNLLDIAGDLGLAGFLVANVVLAGSAAVKVGTGLARVDLKSLPLINKLTGTSTAIGSYFYGIMTPPWAAYTMYAAGEAIGNGHWYTAGVHLAALPFQVALSYYGIRGLRDDAISMVKSWKEGQDPSRAWPIRLLYPITTIPMAALTGTEAYNQFAQGNHLAGTALAGGTLMQAYFIDMASRRLNWTDADVRHGPFRRLAGDNRLAADENRIWAGVGLTLTGGMLIPGALIDLRDYLEDKELLPDWEWLIADLESEGEPNETPVDITNYLRDNELIPGWVWRLANIEGKKEPDDTPVTEDVSGRSEQEDTSPSQEPTPQQNGGDGRHEEEHERPSSRPWIPSPHIADTQRRTNPHLEDEGHDWVEVEPHLSLGGIAISRGHDVAQVVELNLGHISDPGTLHPGDRIYFPKRELA